MGIRIPLGRLLTTILGSVRGAPSTKALMQTTKPLYWTCRHPKGVLSNGRPITFSVSYEEI